MWGLALKIRTALVTSWTLKVAQTLQIIRVCNRLSNQWRIVALWLATGSANTYELCMWFQALQNKQWWAFTIRTDWMTMDFANCDGKLWWALGKSQPSYLCIPKENLCLNVLASRIPIPSFPGPTTGSLSIYLLVLGGGESAEWRIQQRSEARGHMRLCHHSQDFKKLNHPRSQIGVCICGDKFVLSVACCKVKVSVLHQKLSGC